MFLAETLFQSPVNQPCVSANARHCWPLLFLRLSLNLSIGRQYRVVLDLLFTNRAAGFTLAPFLNAPFASHVPAISDRGFPSTAFLCRPDILAERAKA